MPWTRRQVKYLLSNGSPLSGAQQDKMKSELHADPSMGHMKKGSSAMKKHNIREIRIEVHRDKGGAITGHTVHHHMMAGKKSKSGAFTEMPESTAHPFSMAESHKITAHIAKHLGLANAGEEAAEAEEHETDEA